MTDTTTLLTVAIPFYYSSPNSLAQLIRLLDSIDLQTFRDFDVVISTQSSPSLLSIPVYSFSLTVVDNSTVKGFIPENFNSLLDHATGSWIKIMYSDDYFSSINDLFYISNVIRSTASSWCITCSLNKRSHSFFYSNAVRPFYCRFLLDVNTIGSPSCLVLRNSSVRLPRMDSQSWMLLDCDYYISLFKLYGYPKVINNVFVVNELHNAQFSSLRRSRNSEVIHKLSSEYLYLCRKNDYLPISPLFKLLLRLFVLVRRKIDLFRFVLFNWLRP